MPIYEYKCSSCDQISEYFKSIKSNDKVEKCTFCGGKAYKIVSLSTFVLKGTGWYATDYKKPSMPGETTTGAKHKTEVKSEKKETKESRHAVLDKASNG